MLIKSLLPLLAFGQRDGEDEDGVQCVACNSTSILILGGVAENGNFYNRDGYEYFKDFILNEYELGEFNPALVRIDDSLRMNATDSICDDLSNVVERNFAELNSDSDASGFNVLFCQGGDICGPIEKCYRDAEYTPNVTLMTQMGYVSKYAPSLDLDIYSIIAEYDGYFTLADEEDAISYMNSFVPFPRNLNMQFLAHSNVRKWSDATKPFPFLYELDIDTKNRRRVIFRSLLRGLVNFIDSNSVGKRRNTQEAQDFIKGMALLRKMESGNRRDQSLAEVVQQNILKYLDDPAYERLLQHTYVDDIKTVEQNIDGLYMNIYSQVDRSPDERYVQSGSGSVSLEYLTKVFSPNEHIGCHEIQEEILTETLDYLNDKQMTFYSVHSCEMIAADAIITSDESEWGYRRSEMSFVDGYMYIEPIEYRNEDKLSCKLISPARILQWLMSDSHRYQNLKSCHEQVGKKPCLTCPEEEDDDSSR